MKKKVSRRAGVSHPKSTTRPRKPVQNTTRIIYIGFGIVLFVFGFVFTNRHQITKSVAGVSIMRGVFAEATVQLPRLPGAVSYNIYYRKSGDHTFTSAVRNISPETSSYIISYLRKGVSYEYQVSAENDKGSEFWFSSVEPLTPLRSM